MADRDPVVIDTSVVGAKLAPRRAALAASYEPLLADRPLFVSFITDAELRFGARRARWGPTRLGELAALLTATQIVWPAPDLTNAYVELRNACAEQGHPFGLQREHEADRWIAATAIWLDVPLVANDAVFRGVPGLMLHTMLGE